MVQFEGTSHLLQHGCPDVGLGVRPATLNNLPSILLFSISCGWLPMFLRKTWTHVVLSLSFWLHLHPNILQRAILQTISKYLGPIWVKEICFWRFSVVSIQFPMRRWRRMEYSFVVLTAKCLCKTSFFIFSISFHELSETFPSKPQFCQAEFSPNTH